MTVWKALWNKSSVESVTDLLDFLIKIAHAVEVLLFC
jgi:hypothetical protein